MVSSEYNRALIVDRILQVDGDKYPVQLTDALLTHKNKMDDPTGPSIS